MSQDFVIWHNPRCSKSRQTLQLLRDAGVEPEVVEYLKTPPDAAEIKRILGLLGVEPLALMRTKEKVFKELDLASDADRIAAMAEHPILIERPVVIRGGQARLGRSPEAVQDLL